MRIGYPAWWLEAVGYDSGPEPIALSPSKTIPDIRKNNKNPAEKNANMVTTANTTKVYLIEDCLKICLADESFGKERENVIATCSSCCLNKKQPCKVNV